MKNLFKKIVVKILTWEARLALHHYSPKIIAVTGTVGKTSTKDAIHAVISGKFRARKSDKSFNSEIGVPLAILGLKNVWSNPFKWAANFILGFWRIFFAHNYPRVLVLEVGADKPGDIKQVVSWVKPDIAVLTALAPVPVHVEKFGSAEEVYMEKMELIQSLGPRGVAILNADDNKVLALSKKIAVKKITFGITNLGDVFGSNLIHLYSEGGKPIGSSLRIDYQGKSLPFEIVGNLGQGQAYALLSAVAVATTLGMNILEIAEAAKGAEGSRGRMRVLSGIKNSVIIDDTYNSSPIAAKLALDTLRELKNSGRKIAVLGDMLELGEYSAGEHKKIGRLVAGVVDLLLTVGAKSRDVADGALDADMGEQKILQFEESRQAGRELQSIIKEGDIILVKGSQGMRMERAVEEIMLEPERKQELLVRQEREWLKKD